MAALLLLLFGFTGLAAPAFACSECDVNQQNIDFCRPVLDGEVGGTVCEAWPGYCAISGSACSEVDVTTGGGSGGSGGGGGGCNTSGGLCPAACFSCSGGGGRPRI